MIKKLDDILDKIKGYKDIILSVAAAHDEEVLLAVKCAFDMNIIKPILIGDENKIRKISQSIDFDLSEVEIIQKNTIEECAETAVKLVSSKKADLVMKGILDTSIILKAVLNKDWGLRTDSLLSHVMIYEIPTYNKLMLITDGGMNISPNYEQKVKILENSIQAIRPLGLEKIKVACLAAIEKVNPKMEATVDARKLQEVGKKGYFGKDVIVEGPLAFDIAACREAAKIKGFESEVAGDIDIMLMPTIEVGNGIGKSLSYFANAESAGIVMGAKAPIVLVSRSESHESKLYSIAYGALIVGHYK